MIVGILGYLRSSFRSLRSPHVLGSLLTSLCSLAVTLMLADGQMRAEAADQRRRRKVIQTAPMRVIDQVQRALLNRDLPEGPGTKMRGRYLPAATEAHVGGDWYDAFLLDDGRMFFSMGDVAGHGIEAAGHMVATRQAILVAALQNEDPAKALAYANRAAIIQGAPMVTAVCGFIDMQTRTLDYATAGHPPMLLVSDNGTEYLPYNGILLGVDADATYTTFRRTVEPGAMLVMYTDGLIEFERDIFSAGDKLLDAARAAACEDDPAACIERTMFAETAPIDDVAILTIVFDGQPAVVVARDEVTRTARNGSLVPHA